MMEMDSLYLASGNVAAFMGASEFRGVVSLSYPDKTGLRPMAMHSIPVLFRQCPSPQPVCITVCIYVCIYVCVHAYLGLYICMWVPASLRLCMFSSISVCKCVCKCVCVCVCLDYVCVGVNQTAWFASRKDWSK